MKSANIVKYICLTLLALILLAAYSSRSIENMTLTKVVLAKPFKGTITTPVEGFRPEIIRVRTQANLMLEDIFIDSGDEIKFGDPIASVYSVDVDRQIADIETANGTTGSMEYAFLTMLRENGYVIHAEAAGKILSGGSFFSCFSFSGIKLNQTSPESFGYALPAVIIDVFL